MNLQDLQYFAAVAENRHFSRAALACHVSQPTLSGQLRKLEEHLGVTLFERTNKSVVLTPAGEKILEHARKALDQAALMEMTARSMRDQLAGPLRLGAIPTLAPYLMPLILGRLREACRDMPIELWEDQTHALLELLRNHRLDAALIANEVPEGDLTAAALFVEPFLAALPPSHALAGAATVKETDLGSDLLVLADGHCLAAQALRARHRAKDPRRGSFRASTLDTLVNLVAAGYGTTLVPALAAEALARRNVVLRPLAGGASRTIWLASRPSFPRPKALEALAKVIRGVRPPVPQARTASKVSRKKDRG